MSEQGKIQVQTYFAGCDTDTNPEYVNVKEGNCYDAYNFRLSSISGNKQAREKIRGEEVEHDTFIYPDGSTKTLIGYTCIGALYVKGYKVCFFAKSGEDSLITIDDMIVCESSDLGYTYNHHLQIDKNESCVGGEVFPTDNNISPLIFNVKDMIDKYNSYPDDTYNAYFDDFNINAYSISIGAQNDVPVFIGVEQVGIADALPCGSYSYAMRYVDADGNRTQWSASTPLIPLPKNYHAIEEEYVYPMQNTYGGDLADATGYGIKLKFRISNVNNYSYIELRRIAYTGSGVFDFVPAPAVYKLPIDLAPGQVSVYDYFTDKNSLVWLPTPDDEEALTLSSIKTAKAVRYFKNRLIYGNVSFNSKDLSSADITINSSKHGRAMYPFLNEIGREGHADPYNATYFKSYPTGEGYRFGLVCYDENRERSLVLPINTSDYTFPNRREEAVDDTIELSKSKWKGMPKCADLTNATKEVHEVFAFRDTDTARLYDYESGFIGMPKIDVPGSSSPYYYIGLSWDTIGRYNPLGPKFLGDTSLTATSFPRYNVCPEASLDYGSPSASYYAPKYFAPVYYATGITIPGFSNIVENKNNNWIKSFSIVRTKRANRVIAQGIGFYKMTPSNAGTGMQKARKTFVFYSDDVNQGVNTDLFTQANITNLKVQFVSPLGMFSEMYGGEHNSLFGVGDDRGIDLAVYARLYHTKSSNGLGLLENAAGDYSYYTKFGAWRNTVGAIFGAPVNGNKIFDISSISGLTKFDTDSRVDHFYEITLVDDLYITDTAVKGGDANDATNIAFDEPVYIVNIISEDASIADSNTTTYYETGHCQKIEGIIGVSNGAPVQNYPLVDERWEDSIPPQYNDYDVTPDASTNCYLSVKDNITGQNRDWINITNKSQSVRLTILNDITNNGFYLSHNIEDGSVTTVYGVYFHTWPSNDRDFVINFYKPSDAVYSSYSNSLFIPSDKQQITVNYDNRFPLKVFGGDVFVGESIFCPIDGLSNNDGTVRSQFKANKGFPYPAMYFSDTYGVIQSANGATNRWQNSSLIHIDKIRQMVVLFTAESVVNMPLLFNDISADPQGVCSVGADLYKTFPRINYVQRPITWSTTCDLNFSIAGGGGANKIDETYIDDFPGEFSQWNYGGFKYSALVNIDYSQYKNDKTYINTPKVGFKEQTDFCTGIIWSAEREVNQQDSPNLKTFPSLNVYYLSDKNGEIKYLYNSTSEKGDNIYAFTDTGTALLFVEKNTLTDAVGNGLAFFSSADNFIAEEHWLSNDIGMNSEWWRSAAETNDSIYWGNDAGVFSLVNNQITDIARGKNYYSKFQTKIVSKADSTTKMCAGIDILHDEYMLDVGGYVDGLESVKTVTVNANTAATLTVGYVIVVVSSPAQLVVNTIYAITYTATGVYYYYWNGSSLTTVAKFDFLRDIHANFVYNTELQLWHGEYDYDYEKYITSSQQTWGVKDGIIYKLNSGYLIDNSPISAKLISVCNDSQPFDKEYISIAIASDKKPTRVNFAETISAMPECSLYSGMSTPANTYYLKDYGKWTNKIPRKDASTRDRVQSRYMAFEIIHETAEDMYIVDTIVNYKVLKLQL